tara:strand:- start:884 stop:2200 length:1317 start_codon:yes stop_codon:yes gene_type:complete
MPTGPAARRLDPVAHEIPGKLLPGPASFNVIIGGKPAWRGVPTASAAGLKAAKKASDVRIQIAETATRAAMATPAAPAAKAAEIAIKAAELGAMSATIAGASGGADTHLCRHGPGVVIDGSPTVLINGLPACRQGDTILEASGRANRIVMGEVTVLVGNGRAIADEKITSESGWTASDYGHLALDLIGFIPILGEFADLSNAIWYVAEGDFLEAGLSLISMIPVVGDVIGKGGKLIVRSSEFIAKPALELLSKLDFGDLLRPLRNHPALGTHIDTIAGTLHNWRKRLFNLKPKGYDAGAADFANLSGHQVNTVAETLAKRFMKGDGDRIVLGKYPGYKDEAINNGGIYFDAGTDFFKTMEAQIGRRAANERMWLINRAFLRQQLDKGMRIDITQEGLRHAKLNPDSFSAREINYISQYIRENPRAYRAVKPGIWTPME